MTEPIVELRDVFCVHRTAEGDAAALQGLSLSVTAHEIVCVVGPSGAGKSTLLRVIAGIQLPAAGVVTVLGRDIGRLPARTRARLRHDEIGFLGQRAHAALSPALRVREAVALPLALRGSSRRERAPRVDELLDAAGLRDRAQARPAELSGGERQRSALCAAVAHRPSLLLADEPTGELDAAAAERIRRLIGELARQGGTSVIVVSHDPVSAEGADRAVRIRDGRVAEDRRDGEPVLVVGAGGWVQLPPELRANARIGGYARARPVPGGVMLSAAQHGAADPPTVPPHSGPDVGEPAPWIAARVEARAVACGFAERPVLTGLTHSFAPGRLTVVTGRSGTGKTTLLRLLAGLHRADAGHVLLDEVALDELDVERIAALRRRRIGYLPQEPEPVAFLSASENVELALRVRGWDAEPAARRAAVALARVGLADRARQRVHRLSSGEAQRVALARALASARGLLIVDEPTSRLDEAGAAEVAELLAAAGEDGQTVICATHDPTVIARADAILALDGVTRGELSPSALA
jgi:ABC-type lipoprotein export system ATPase subunit